MSDHANDDYKKLHWWSIRSKFILSVSQAVVALLHNMMYESLTVLDVALEQQRQKSEGLNGEGQ